MRFFLAKLEISGVKKKLFKNFTKKREQKNNNAEKVEKSRKEIKRQGVLEKVNEAKRDESSLPGLLDLCQVQGHSCNT